MNKWLGHLAELTGYNSHEGNLVTDQAAGTIEYHADAIFKGLAGIMMSPINLWEQ